MIPVLPRAG